MLRASGDTGVLAMNLTNNTDREVLILLSGGVDSAACVRFYLEIGRLPAAIFVDYGQPAREREASAASDIAKYYGLPFRTAQWRGSRPKTVGDIPGRNAFLLSAALMERVHQEQVITIGIHSGTAYADCSHAFVERMQALYDLYTNGEVRIAAPFESWSKADVWTYALAHDVPVQLSYSCEASSESPCGVCESCKDRESLDRHGQFDHPTPER